MEIQFRRATLDDVPMMADMNAQLIADEANHNPMTLPELEARMRGWLTTETYHAILLLHAEHGVLGYLMYRMKEDDYYPFEPMVYVRQFFIKRRFRRRGIGAIAFERIADKYFPAEAMVTLDVLESNPEGKAFWQKLGFEVYHVRLRRRPQ